MKYKTLFLDSIPVQLAIYEELISRGIPNNDIVKKRLEEGSYLSIGNDNQFYHTRNEVHKDGNPDYYGPVTVEEMLAIKPKQITVTLNENHRAIVTKDKITVGCQVFDAAVLHKLVEAHRVVSTV